MNLYKLDGYNAVTEQYIDPNTGEPSLMPSSNFVIADIAPNNYSLFDSPENWANYAINLIGSVFGLRDYLSFRYEIYTRIEAITGTDYANYNSLTTEQKIVALIWCNIRIVNVKGMTFYATECGSQSVADSYISSYLNSSPIARALRYDNAFTIYGFTYLGKLQGLKAESYARQYFLDTTYINRGVVFLADDGIEGLGDWILGQNSFISTGLKPRIIAGEFNLGYGMDVTTFCDTLVGIVNDGAF